MLNYFLGIQKWIPDARMCLLYEQILWRMTEMLNKYIEYYRNLASFIDNSICLSNPQGQFSITSNTISATIIATTTAHVFYFLSTN